MWVCFVLNWGVLFLFISLFSQMKWNPVQNKFPESAGWSSFLSWDSFFLENSAYAPNVPWRTVGARRRVPPAQGSEETWRPCGRYFLRSGNMAQQEEGIWGRRQSLGEPPRPASPSILPSTCPPVFLSPSSHPPVPLSTLFSKALPAAQCLWPESGCILCSFLPSRLPYDPSS